MKHLFFYIFLFGKLKSDQEFSEQLSDQEKNYLVTKIITIDEHLVTTC